LNRRIEMGSRQLPFEFFDYSYYDLTDGEQELLNYFTEIEDSNIQKAFDKTYKGRGPKGFEVHSFLAQMLKVKENFLSDRDLTYKLLSNSIYRFCCGFKHKNEIPAHNTYTYLRKRLGVWGYIEIHINFVSQAYRLGILDPDVPVLPKNRRPGLILIADSSFLYAHCSKSGVRDENDNLIFKDPSVNIGRAHHRYKFPLGHRVHTLHAINGVPLVSLVVGANWHDIMYLVPLLDEFRRRFPRIEVSYIILDKGYDVEPIHEIIYKSYGIIPIIIRKEDIKYPKGFHKDGTPLCYYGFPLRRKVTDYKRQRTQYVCDRICIGMNIAQQELFPCPFTESNQSKYGLVKYTRFKDSIRLYGPATPNSRIYQTLKPFRTGIERDFALVKENRYRLQETLNYEGFNAVQQHVTLFDIVLTQDKIFKSLTK
jgi:hypothetical protein